MVNARGVTLLTPREEQVVALVADGLSNREVARELGLSEHTVKKYMFHIFDKLGISSRVELVLYAVRPTWRRPGRRSGWRAEADRDWTDRLVAGREKWFHVEHFVRSMQVCMYMRICIMEETNSVLLIGE